jgi:hypothetical protein
VDTFSVTADKFRDSTSVMSSPFFRNLPVSSIANDPTLRVVVIDSVVKQNMKRQSKGMMKEMI